MPPSLFIFRGSQYSPLRGNQGQQIIFQPIVPPFVGANSGNIEPQRQKFRLPFSKAKGWGIGQILTPKVLAPQGLAIPIRTPPLVDIGIVNARLKLIDITGIPEDTIVRPSLGFAWGR
jgi:hypothetical protein